MDTPRRAIRTDMLPIIMLTRATPTARTISTSGLAGAEAGEAVGVGAGAVTGTSPTRPALLMAGSGAAGSTARASPAGTAALATVLRTPAGMAALAMAAAAGTPEP